MPQSCCSDYCKFLAPLFKGTYGDVMSFKVMGQRLVILNDVDVVNEAFNREVFSGWPSSFLNDVFLKKSGIVVYHKGIFRLDAATPI